MIGPALPDLQYNCKYKQILWPHLLFQYIVTSISLLPFLLGLWSNVLVRVIVLDMSSDSNLANTTLHSFFLYSNIHEKFRIISSEEDHIALEFWTFFTRIAAPDNYLVTEFLSIFLCFCETFNIIVLLSLPEADHIFGPGSYIFAEWKPLISYVR